MATSNRKFGVEIEAYDVDMAVIAQELRALGIACNAERYNHETRPSWKVVTDASLGGLRNSFEVVSPVLEGQSGLDQVATVCNTLERLGAKVNKQCGLHVHVDARDYGFVQVRNCLQFFGKLEKFFDSMQPESRRNNRFCASVLHGLPYEEFHKKCELAGSIQGLRGVLGFNRYHKLNIESLERHGTIEFRQHSGTVNAEKAVNWIKLCTAFIEKTASYQYVQLKRPVSVDSILNHLDAKGKRFYRARIAEFAAQ